MTRPDDVEWRRREELRSLLTALRSRRGGNGGKRLRQDDAAILSGLSTRRYAALERGAVENPSLDLIENVASGLRMTPAERSALHVLSRGQDPPMPPATPGGEQPEIGPGQRELIARLDAPAAITDETWTLVIRNKALTAWTDGWFDRVPRASRISSCSCSRPQLSGCSPTSTRTAALSSPGCATSTSAISVRTGSAQ